MRHFLGAAILVLTALPAVAQNSAPPSAAQPAAGTSAIQNSANVQHGRELFMADGCSECHGTAGEGGAAGPRIAPNPMEPDPMARYIRDPHGEMPPYSATVLDDRGVQDIQAYLASLPQPPALSSIPILNE
jgi:mono/diheme cytochrome c family protein